MPTTTPPLTQIIELAERLVRQVNDRTLNAEQDRKADLQLRRGWRERTMPEMARLAGPALRSANANRYPEMTEVEERLRQLNEACWRLINLVATHEGQLRQLGTAVQAATRGTPDEEVSFQRLATCLHDAEESQSQAIAEVVLRINDVEKIAESVAAAPAFELWIPAERAVEEASKLNHDTQIKWLTQDAPKHGVRVRPRELPGRHKKEVEWGTLAAYLLGHRQPREAQRKTEGCTNAEAAHGIQQANAQRRTERPVV
jgi:hypothetical protein